MLDKEFPGKLEYEPIKDIDTTGNFEITLMQTRQLIHSKTHGKGLGKCDSEPERTRLRSIIKVYLDYADNAKKK